MKQIFKKIYSDSMQDYLYKVDKYLETEEKKMIITANSEIISSAETDKSVEKMLLDKKVDVVADGIIIVKAAKDFGIKLKERIPGVEIAEHLIKEAHQRKLKIYFFGSKQEVLDKLQQKMKEYFPGAQIVGMQNGYLEDNKEVIADIKKQNPDICLVALGVPTQEKFIYENISKFKKGIFVGVGGSLDVISGSKKRAPKFFRNMKLEWLYRIIKEPSRLNRFYNSNIKFIFKVRKEIKKGEY